MIGQLAHMARKLTSVVSMTRGRLMPSTPMKYSMLKEGIQGMLNTACICDFSTLKKAADCGAKNAMMERASVARQTPNVT